MNSIIQQGWDLTFNSILPITPVFKTVRDYMTNLSYPIYKAFQAIGLGADKKDFDDIYKKALIKLEQKTHTHPDVVKIFSDKTIMSYFYDSFAGSISIKELFEHIYAHLYLNDELAPLRSTIHQDTEELMKLFLQTVFEEMDPGQKYTISRVNDIKQDTEAIMRENKEMKEEMKEGMKEMMKAIMTNQSEEMQRLREELTSQLATGMPTAIPDTEATQMTQADFEENVSPILDQLEKKRNRAAIDLLNDLKTRKWERFTDLQRFKVDFALGRAYLELGEFPEAAELFISLFDTYPSNADAAGVTAMGHAMKNENELAIHYAEKALKDTPGLPSAIVARILVLPESAPIQDLEEILAEADTANPMVALNAAEWLLTKGAEHYERALELMQKAQTVEGTMPWAEKLERMANINARIAVDEIISAAKEITDTARQRLLQSAEWLTQAKDFYKNTDLQHSKWSITANRGVIQKLLGNKTKAEADLFAALDEKKNFFIYHHLLVLALENREDCWDLIQEARQHLSLTKEQEEELLIMELQCLLERKNGHEIIRLLDEQPETDDEMTNCKMRYFRALAMAQNGDPKGALKLMTDTADEYPHNPQISHLAAELAIEIGDEKTAHKYTSLAANALGEEPANNILIGVVSQCHQLGHDKEVISILDKPRFKKRWNNLLELLIISLQRTGNTLPAIELVEQFYDPQSPIALCAHVLIEANEQACEFASALVIANNAIQHFPDHYYFRAKKLAYYIRINDQENVDSILQDLIDQQWSIDKRMAVWSLAVHSAGPQHAIQGLQVGLGMRNENPADLAHHMAYAHLFHDLMKLGIRITPEHAVMEHCVVELYDQLGQQKTIVIDHTGMLENAVPIDSEEAQALVGQMTNSIVTIGGKQYQIRNIKNGFQAAFEESMRKVEKTGG